MADVICHEMFIGQTFAICLSKMLTTLFCDSMLLFMHVLLD